MKLPYQQLITHLKHKLAPIYLISGDELFLVQEAITNLREAASLQGFTERESFQVTTTFNWQNFLLAANNISLFNEKILLELNFTNNKLGNTGSKALREYANNPNLDRLLLIVMSKLDAATQKSAWFTAIDKVGVTMQIWPLDKRQFYTWLRNKIQCMGLNIEPEAIRLLAEFTAGNLLATNQELEKLFLLYAKQKISAPQLLAAITDNARFDIFDLTNSIYAGQQKQIIRILENLKNTTTPTPIILWAITREIRLLLNVIYALQTGKNLEQILQKYRVHYSRKPLIKQIIKNLEVQKLLPLLQQAGKIDLTIKGATDANVWHELLKLALDFTRCQEICRKY